METKKPNTIMKLVSFILALVFGAVAGAQDVSPKILILYSSIGMGHLSAARAIEQNIKERDPKAIVVLKNIRDFSGQMKAHLDEKAYWYIVKKHPETFDKMFRKAMAKGNEVGSIEELKSGYNTEKLFTFVNNLNPTAIIATHYGSAQALGKMKLQGRLKNLPVGWLHTDYFTGYFPRISKIVEKTFLGMPQMRDTWVQNGVDPTKVVSTGMPVAPALFDSVDREAFLRSKGLDPSVKTIVLASGGEGVGNFPLIVEKISKSVQGKTQLVVVCAKNQKHFDDLNKMKPNLPADLKLVVTQMIPNGELLNYIKSSDLFITKSGGLSPTEGFAITKPMVLLDVYGGHERDNADLFEKEGYAVVNRDQSKIGEDVLKVLNNPELQTKMVAKQLEFRNSFNLGAITDFAFNPRAGMSSAAFGLGVEHGETVAKGKEVLAKLEKDSPADLEIILSYGKSNEGKYFSGDSNPFGHLAVRIGNTVFTANGRAVKGVEPRLMHQTSLYEYLYGVDRPYQNVEHTDAFGSSFGRDNMSLRVNGISPEQLRLMQAEVTRIEAEWQEGKTIWNAKAFNCADFVARILRAGGLTPSDIGVMGQPGRPAAKVTMPLDVFDKYRIFFENAKNARTEIVMYSHVPNSQNVYKTTRYPLSYKQIKRSLLNVVLKRVDPIELQIGKRVAFHDSAVATYENVNGVSARDQAVAAKTHEEKQTKALSEIESLEASVEKIRSETTAAQLTSQSVLKDINTALTKFSPTELTAILKSNPSEITDAAKRAEAEALISRIKAWDAAQTKLQLEKDKMIQKELDFFINGARFAMNETFETAKATGKKENIEKLKVMVDKAEAQYQEYMKSRDQYGLAKDGPLRTYPYRAFFLSAKDYFDALKTTPESQNAPSQKFWQKLAQKSARLYHMLTTFTKIAPATLKALVNIWFRTETAAGKSPVNESVGNVFKKMAKELGISIEIKDSAKLPKPGVFDGKNINIVVPTHRDPIFDTMVMFHMNLNPSLLVMATDQIVGMPKMADKVNSVDSVITVGRGSNLPIDKIKEQLARNKSNTILIYPEGSVSTGFSETRPLREKFATGLLNQLTAAGFNVNLIPVTYENTSRFVFESSVTSILAQFGKKDAIKLTAQVHDPLDGRVVELLNKVTGSETAVNRLIRSIWLEHLPTDNTRLMGALRAGTALQMMNKTLGVDVSGKRPTVPTAMTCEKLF